MSYDLMVFDTELAPSRRGEFMAWYENQAQWSEDHSYEDPSVSAEALQRWFQEIITTFPPMNGPNASEDPDDENVTDYCIGKSVIYAAFAWSRAEVARPRVRELAIKHNVGFFDVSTENGEILFPDAAKPWWRFW